MRFNPKNRSLKIEIITSILLVLATFLALILSNSSLKDIYTNFFYDTYIVKDFNIHSFINDFLMAIFFLLAGLEIKEEVLYGSLSSFKKASFPVVASLGGIIVPAIIFYFFNMNTGFIRGVCIPISTDIAFAMGVYYLFSKYLGHSVKIFLLSLAVVDDLASILLIGTLYSNNINFYFLSLGIICLLILIIGNKIYHIEFMIYYILGGLCIWYFIHLSGIHSTLSGILLASAIPSKTYKNSLSTLHKFIKYIRPINNIFIIPIFAFANTGICINSNINIIKYPTVFLGIYLGLLVGKPLGIMMFTYIFNLIGLVKKPNNLSWTSIFLVSLIAGVGFTMSLFVCEVAFINNNELIDASRICILFSGFISMIISSLFIKTFKELHII